MIGEILANGWAASIICATEDSGPLPVGAAIEAQCDAPLYLVGGCSVGEAMQIIRRRYHESPLRDLTLHIPATRAWCKQNLLSFTCFGDPSLKLGVA